MDKNPRGKNRVSSVSLTRCHSNVRKWAEQKEERRIERASDGVGVVT